MAATAPFRWCLPGAWLAALAGLAAGQQAEREKPGPRYLDLRYDEDFRYLDGPEGSYRANLFDPIKNIRLGEHVRLRLGGEGRLRFENEENKGLAPGPQPNDRFLLERLALHADLSYDDRARLFVEGIHADVTDRDEVLFFIHRNRHDIHQLFVDLRPLPGDVPLTVRVGRQEMVYGTERVVSATTWGRVRKRFEGVKVFYEGDAWSTDVWYVRPVAFDESSLDQRDREKSFSGVYTTFDSVLEHGLDLYAMSLRDTGDRVNPNGVAGDRTVLMLGSRVWREIGGLDWELELNAQTGRWAGDRIRAWSAGGGVGYTFDGLPTGPRVGVGFEVASGDSDPSDSTVGTYDQFFRQEKDHLGYLVLFGRQNIRQVNVTLGSWLVPGRVKLDLWHYWYWLQSDQDSVYNPGGLPTPGRRDPSGTSGDELGRAFDLTLGAQLGVNQSLLIGYSTFWNGGFVDATGGGDDPNVFYVQYQLIF